MKLLLAIPVLIAFTLSGCAGGGSGEPVTPEQDSEGRYVVEMVGQKFTPKDIKIPVNSTVVWKYVSGKPHDVTADDGSFSSDDEGAKLGVGPTEYTHTFLETGEWKYYCYVHHSQGMAGSVLVE